MWTQLKIYLVFTVISQTCGHTFPPGFKLGVATASYQVEGGWNATGKGENIWDRLTHTHPELIADHSTGDVACDSYHLYLEDVKILKDLGVDHYRFSLSWPRILPGGFANNINPDGIKYYNNLINALVANGIQPMVTLYHWDLPQVLQDLGGWTNPQLAVYFEDYARVAFTHFGDRVKLWITINEPSSICVDTYEYDVAAPPHLKTPGVGLYLCAKLDVTRVYNNEFKQSQGGKVGITIDSIWAEPRTNKSEDVQAADREMQMQLGWWAHPIYSIEGDYPHVMSSTIANISRAEYFPQSRLPPFSRQEVKLIQGSADFFGLNHYHTWYISDHPYPINTPSSYQKDRGTHGEPTSAAAPWGFRKLLNWVKSEYNNPLVIVTENGVGDQGGTQDQNRVLYLKGFLKALLSALTEDGCNIKGYTVWSIMDNMEWRSGYTIKFGLYDVDFRSSNRTRTPKASAYFYEAVIRTRTIPEK